MLNVGLRQLTEALLSVVVLTAEFGQPSHWRCRIIDVLALPVVGTGARGCLLLGLSKAVGLAGCCCELKGRVAGVSRADGLVRHRSCCLLGAGSPLAVVACFGVVPSLLRCCVLVLYGYYVTVQPATSRGGGSRRRYSARDQAEAWCSSRSGALGGNRGRVRGLRVNAT
jgi:hypothetical protein